MDIDLATFQLWHVNHYMRTFFYVALQASVVFVYSYGAILA